MCPFRTLIRPATAISTIVFLVLAAGCSKPVDTAAPGPTTTAPATSVPQAKSVSKLGDLSALKTIATDVATIVNKGELPTAKTRIKDLEVAWDSAEAGLKPRAADDWHVVDKSIDHALSALRADTPSQADCKKVMAELLQTFDSLQGKV